MSYGQAGSALNIGIYLPEECVGQNYIIQVATCWVIQDVSVDEEQERHIYLLPCKKLLFLKTEAFHL